MICKFSRRSLVEVSFKVLVSILPDSWVAPISPRLSSCSPFCSSSLLLKLTADLDPFLSTSNLAPSHPCTRSCSEHTLLKPRPAIYPILCSTLHLVLVASTSNLPI